MNYVKIRAFSDPYFPVYGQNCIYFFVFHLQENADQTKLVFRHISRRARCEICSKLTIKTPNLIGLYSGRAYIRNVSWVTYLGGLYTREGGGGDVIGILRYKLKKNGCRQLRRYCQRKFCAKLTFSQFCSKKY